MHKDIHFISADVAVKVVKSGDHIHFSSVAAAPRVLIDALCRRGDTGEPRNVRIHHLHTEGAAPYTNAKYEGIFFHQAFFVGGNVRKNVQAGYADYIPIFLSETLAFSHSLMLPSSAPIMGRRAIAEATYPTMRFIRPFLIRLSRFSRMKKVFIS